MRHNLILVALVLFTLAFCAACTDPIVTKHPAVDTSELLPVPMGFTFDRSYPARSEPAAQFYDYALSANKVLSLQDASELLKRELQAKGWEFVGDDTSHWAEDKKWNSQWRREISESQWDDLRVTFQQEFDGKNIATAKATIVYQMGAAR